MPGKIMAKAEKLVNTEVSHPVPEKHSMSLWVEKHIGVLSLRRGGWRDDFLSAATGAKKTVREARRGASREARPAYLSRRHVETLGGEENQGERDCSNQIVTEVWSRRWVGGGQAECYIHNSFIQQKAVKHLPWAMFWAWDMGESPFEISHSSRKVLEYKSNSLIT